METFRRRWPVWLVIAGILVFGGWRLGGVFGIGATSGEVLALGDNVQSQIGGQNRVQKNAAFAPLDLGREGTIAAQKFISAKSGHYHTVLLSENGKVYTLGGNSSRAVRDTPVLNYASPQEVVFDGLESGEKIVQIDTSRDHNLALTSSGRVYAWGANVTGQLGDGSNQKRGQPKVVANLPKATGIAAGYRHSVAITEDGSVYSWGGKCTEEAYSVAQKMLEQVGSNIGALGGYGSMSHEEGADDASECTTQDSTFVQSKTPKKLKGLEGRAEAISAGYGHLLILTDKGEVFSGGCNTYGQLGRAKPTVEDPNRNDLAKVELPQPASQITSGYRHSAVILQDGSLWLWGYNGDGRVLGVESLEPTVKVPMQSTAGKKFVQAEAAHDTTFVSENSGQIWGWGQDDAGAFWPDVTLQAAKDFGKMERLLGISAGLRHVLVLKH